MCYRPALHFLSVSSGFSAPGPPGWLDGGLTHSPGGLSVEGNWASAYSSLGECAGLAELRLGQTGGEKTRNKTNWTEDKG